MVLAHLGIMAPVGIDPQFERCDPVQLHRVILNLFRRPIRRERPLLTHYFTYLPAPARKYRELLRALPLPLDKLEMNPPDRLRFIKFEPDYLRPGLGRPPSRRGFLAQRLFNREMRIFGRNLHTRDYLKSLPVFPNRSLFRRTANRDQAFSHSDTPEEHKPQN